MERTSLVKAYIDQDETRSNQFTIIDEQEGKLVVRSTASMGKADTSVSMLMIVRDGRQFTDLYARLCTFKEKDTAEKMMQYANFIQNNYSGIRAGIQFDDEDDEYSFYMSIENFFDEDDENVSQIFYLDGYLTHVISEEYDKLMKVLYS